MRNLAWISLARVYYTAANQGKGGQIDGTLLGQSVESWTKVEQASEYWLDSLFESSWAFFLADEYSRALGNVHTLYSPYFEDSFYPEALVLKAVTFFVNCQVDNAEATVAQFHHDRSIRSSRGSTPSCRRTRTIRTSSSSWSEFAPRRTTVAARPPDRIDRVE